MFESVVADSVGGAMHKWYRGCGLAVAMLRTHVAVVYTA